MVAYVEHLTPAQLQSLLARGEVAVIDVREPDEFAFARIAGSINAPLSTFHPSELKLAGHRRVVLVCGSGKRAQIALDRCENAGVAVDGCLAGGVIAWREAGLPLLKAGLTDQTA